MPGRIAIGVALGVLAVTVPGCARSDTLSVMATQPAAIRLAMKGGRCAATVSDPRIKVKKNDVVEWTVDDQCDQANPQVTHVTTLRDFKYSGPNDWLPWLTPRSVSQASATTKYGQHKTIRYVAIDGDLVSCATTPEPNCDYVDYEVYIDAVKSVDPRIVWDR